MREDQPGGAPRRDAFELKVTAGRDRGARLRVGSEPALIGRLPTASLVLDDPHVSRRQLEATATPTGVRLTRLPGAARASVDGHNVESADLRVGDAITVGETTLTVVGLAASAVTVTEVLDARDGAEAHAFGSMVALARTLLHAHDVDDAEARVDAWARAHCGALAARFLREGPSPALENGSLGGELRIAMTTRRLHVHAPLRCAGEVGLDIVLPLELDIDERTRHLFAMAALMATATLVRLEGEVAAREDAALLRRAAIGSARSFLGISPTAEHIALLIPRLAASDATVLLLGESGVGKSFLARLLHENGPRAREPFRVVNCAAIPEALFESELFGSVRGAFPGAISRAGPLESAGAGTVLLDELAEMPLASQAKLLRVLEDGRLQRVGSTATLPMNARIIATTSRDLAQRVAAGSFRPDLYYRISVVPVHLPPLRERGEDVPVLAQQLLADLAAACGRRVEGFSRRALAALRAYGWPGNVHELRNAVEAALVMGEGDIVDVRDLPIHLTGVVSEPRDGDDPWVIRVPATLAQVERQAIAAALHATGGNRTRAAGLLGVSRQTLYTRLREREDT